MPPRILPDNGAWDDSSSFRQQLWSWLKLQAKVSIAIIGIAAFGHLRASRKFKKRAPITIIVNRPEKKTGAV